MEIDREKHQVKLPPQKSLIEYLKMAEKVLMAREDTLSFAEDICEAIRKIRELEQENERLREVLEWYADKKIYLRNLVSTINGQTIQDVADIEDDLGQKAREILRIE